MSAGKKATRKPTAKAVRDRRLLSKAAREEREGAPVSEGIARAAELSGIATVTIVEPEFRAVIARMKELTHVIIHAWDGGAGGLEKVLLELHETRSHLELSRVLGKKAVAS